MAIFCWGFGGLLCDINDGFFTGPDGARFRALTRQHFYRRDDVFCFLYRASRRLQRACGKLVFCDQKTIDLLSEGTLPTSANAALVFLERLLQKAPPVTAPHAPDSAYKSPLGASKNARPTTADDTLKNAA